MDCSCKALGGDAEKATLADSNVKELFVRFPVLHLLPAEGQEGQGRAGGQGGGE